MTKPLFHLRNVVTGEIAFTSERPSLCREFAIKTKRATVERSRYFRHIIMGDWNIERAATVTEASQ